MENTTMPGRNLHALVAKPRGPSRNMLEIVEGCRGTGRLGKKNSWTFDRSQCFKSP